MYFFGHMVNPNGIHVDPSKIEAVKNRKAPMIPSEVESFLDQQMENKEDGSLYFMDRIWVPLVEGVRTMIMDEAHKSKYSVHPGADKMYYDLRVSPWKGVIRFGKKGNPAPRFVGPFKILERIGPVAYRLKFPEELSGVHDTFHVSNLKKYLADASLHVLLDEIKVDKTLRFVEEPVENSDREVKRFLTSFLDDGRGSGNWMFLFVWSGYAAMRTLVWASKVISSKISLVKVRWNSKRGPEFTWEREDCMKSKYPQLLVNPLELAKGIDGLLVVSVIVTLLWIVDSERDRLIVVDRGTRSVPLFVMLSVTVSTWFGVTPLCCDDIHDVTPRVFALAGCDRLVSEPLVIEKYSVAYDSKEEPIEEEPLEEPKEEE
ncbi:hypothetical protein Tco_0988378 [Tanacetum coccineum]|uniref:Tf2-1-like SH3-like domain-containing protein n=1 Tax=Tanacetum coccineum TaxID=301880 RepID=A0ABQ5ER53_9ASTR